jgi:hypothetical protein
MILHHEIEAHRVILLKTSDAHLGILGWLTVRYDCENPTIAFVALGKSLELYAAPIEIFDDLSGCAAW